MPSWFRSETPCPVDLPTQEWLESRAAWLVEQFGAARVRGVPVILPTPEFFPDPFDGTEADSRIMLDRVCGFMGIAPETVSLSLYEDRNPVHTATGRQGTAGLYTSVGGRFQIWVEITNLSDPLAMVATLAHELGHVHLLGHGRLSTETDDHEPLTDLLTVFLGMGVFSANAVVRESSWTNGAYSGWSMGKLGYLTMPIYGYALALFARVRGELDPAWARELRPDVRSFYRKSVRYLAERDARHAETGAPPKEIPSVLAAGPVVAEEPLAEEDSNCPYCSEPMPETATICDRCERSIRANEPSGDNGEQTWSSGDWMAFWYWRAYLLLIVWFIGTLLYCMLF